MLDIIKDPDAAADRPGPLRQRALHMHAGMFALQDVEGDPEEKRKAVLEVAIDLVTQAHAPRAPAGAQRPAAGLRPGQTVTPLARRKATGSMAEP